MNLSVTSLKKVACMACIKVDAQKILTAKMGWYALFNMDVATMEPTPRVHVPAMSKQMKDVRMDKYVVRHREHTVPLEGVSHPVPVIFLRLPSLTEVMDALLVKYVECLVPWQMLAQCVLLMKKRGIVMSMADREMVRVGFVVMEMLMVVLISVMVALAVCSCLL
jgi:hypothetical protein